LKKVLIICHHRENRSPGQRFRYEQYIAYLKENGYTFRTSLLLNEKDDKAFYKKDNYPRKAFIYLKTILKRTRDWFTMNRYDIIFIFREASITGSTFFERRFAKSKAKLIFDFDDAIWLQNVSDANKKFAFLKNASKTADIIKLCDLIFAGNQYLADYAAQFNKNVTIVPTTIDTDIYVSTKKEDSDTVCIGWSGSFSTIQHFATAIPALQRIQQQFGNKVSFKIIGDGNYYCKELNVKGEPWVAAIEVEDLSKIDIGIMPLPDDEWAKGKCGLKGLQYMALGIPTLMSPVGVNSEIIQQGVNGYLPVTDNEWVDTLIKLIEDKEWRKKVGEAGRQTVLDKYAVKIWKPKYLEHFNSLVG
jgi:glycosyltransferase involved in cell wall biosynthesis